MMQHNEDVRLDKGLDDRQTQWVYSDRPPRLPIVLAPCFVGQDEVRTLWPHFLVAV